MAFIFVPNADGGFDEGDRQTNSDTGVEYIYVDGAWRPLGPKIEDQFDALDERYVNKDGDVIHGTLEFDHGEDTDSNLLIRPNISNESTNIYQLNSGALRLRTLPGEDTNTGSTTHLAIGKNEITGDPETYIYHLQDPTAPLQGVNLQYLESYVSGYLPLIGGDMTGDLNIDKSSGTGLTISKDGQDNLKFWVDGTATTTKTTFANDNFVTKAYVDGKVDSIDPTTLLWKRVSKSAGDLEIGEFYISSSNNNIYLHPKAIGGIDLNMEPRVNTVTGIKHLVSVHKVNGTINYSIVCTEIDFNNGSNNYIRLTSSSVLCEDYTTANQNCRINIPGFTF